MKKQQPHPLFDEVLKEKRLKNDAALCVALRLQPSHVSRMRSGKLPISDAVRVAVMRKCNWSLKRVDALAPPDAEQAG